MWEATRSAECVGDVGVDGVVEWICGSCGEVCGAERPGWLWVSPEEYRAAERLRAWDWVETKRRVEEEGRDWGPLDISSIPPAAHWTVKCVPCLERDEEMEVCGLYEIELTRIASVPAVLHWTAHLMEKDWLAHTDWDELIALVAAAAGSDDE